MIDEVWQLKPLIKGVFYKKLYVSLHWAMDSTGKQLDDLSIGWACWLSLKY